MGAIAFVGDRNAPGKKDWSGAFRPEAERFAKLHGGVVVRVPLDTPKQRQRDLIVHAILNTEGLGYSPAVGFFCHGFSRRIELGFDAKTVSYLARALAEIEASDVGLYTCSTGMGANGGDGGFADLLRDAMCVHGQVDSRVVAHVTPGHATMNPHKRFFHGLGSPVGGCGGVDVVRPGTKQWATWKKRLRDPKDTLRFDILRMDFGDILEAVS